MSKSHIDKLSLAIAVCALGLSLWQGYQQRVQNHVAVEPRINAYFTLDGKTDQNGLYVFNNGLGLIVKSIYGDRFQYNFKNNIQAAL